MVLKFTLRMPNCGSWNGRWSGDERSHTVCKTFRRKADIEKYEKAILGILPFDKRASYQSCFRSVPISA